MELATVLVLLYFCLGQARVNTKDLLEEVACPALIEAAPADADPMAGAWVDADEDGDIDFVLPDVP